MTKIKDLVTVTCSNVFIHYPVDSERYELIVAVGKCWHNRVYGCPSTLPSGDMYINSMVKEIELTMTRCADALATLSFRPSTYLTRLDRDRAQRAYACLTQERYRELIRGKTEQKVAGAICTQLLGQLYSRLLLEHHESERPNRTGGIP